MLPLRAGLILVLVSIAVGPVKSDASDFIDVLQLGAEIFTKVFDVWQDYPAKDGQMVDADNGMPPAPWVSDLSLSTLVVKGQVRTVSLCYSSLPRNEERGPCS